MEHAEPNAAAPESAPAEVAPAPPPARSPALGRGVILFTLALSLGFLGFMSPMLWREWQSLRVAWDGGRKSYVVGYPGINENPSYARIPDPWFRQEGNSTLFWAAWVHGQGHVWFKVGRGEIERNRLHRHSARDVIQTIDRPLIESGGGTYWDKILPEARVAALVENGQSAAYPIAVLQRVHAVHDTVGARPVLLLYASNPVDGEVVHQFDPRLDDRRLTFADTGYLYDRRPLLYDRETESLWSNRDDGLTALAGRLKGSTLPRRAILTLIAWGDWKARNPSGQLLVGAERTRPQKAVADTAKR